MTDGRVDEDPGAGSGGEGGGGGGGGGGGEPPTPGGPPGAATELLTKIANSECDQSFACKATYPADFGPFEEVFGADLPACYALNIEFYDAPAMEALVAAGKVAIDTQLAATCTSELAAAIPACMTFWDDGMVYPEACDTAFKGMVPAGGACEDGIECVVGTFCGFEGTCELE